MGCFYLLASLLCRYCMPHTKPFPRTWSLEGALHTHPQLSILNSLSSTLYPRQLTPHS